MFVLELTYKVPLERVDEALPEHAEWLRRHFEAGDFLAAGRKVPRDGGVIIAVGDDRAAVEALTATDPFSRLGLAEYRVVEFVAARTAPALAEHQAPPA
jgi:uncharacterized protein YciI